jgi:hypothetical protein
VDSNDKDVQKWYIAQGGMQLKRLESLVSNVGRAKQDSIDAQPRSIQRDNWPWSM